MPPTEVGGMRIKRGRSYMYIDCDQAKQTFLDYVFSFDTSNPRIALKLDHSLRVAETSRKIAQSEALPQQDCDLAWLIGLLHDIGRFEQLRRWNTFSDAQSTSHADLSVAVLFDKTKPCLLRSFCKDSTEDDLIRTAIQLHSVFHLPENLSSRTRFFCDLVRDADKLDIIGTIQNSDPMTIMNYSEQELVTSKLSPEVKNAFFEHRCVKKEERHYPADFVIGFICFIFELKFSESFRIALKNNDALELATKPFGITLKFTNPDTKDFFEIVAKQVKEFLAIKA